MHQETGRYGVGTQHIPQKISLEKNLCRRLLVNFVQSLEIPEKGICAHLFAQCCSGTIFFNVMDKLARKVF